jgi:hypothetical protein
MASEMEKTTVILKDEVYEHGKKDWEEKNFGDNKQSS